ncbi:hypothetical protein DSO57_1019286 [Entomophthora muscae]|uniref:Uncharacterized protein n=1 Tax=Entomophthora muscae TaxID=34485 RepID=A0ACC2S674_9FUNG|nr:hypothetical protein DSO57_1019286 [Entomophthora muscae]
MKLVVLLHGTFCCANPLSSIREVLLSVPPFPWWLFPRLTLYKCNTIIINTSFVFTPLYSSVLSQAATNHQQCVKKPAKEKSLTPSPPPHLLLLHLLPLHPHLQLPPKSSNKSDDSLTDHSFYESEADSEPTKKRCTKKSKAAKEPTSSGKKKEASKKALKNPSPPPPDGSFPLPHLTPRMSQRNNTRILKLLVI